MSCNHRSPELADLLNLYFVDHFFYWAETFRLIKPGVSTFAFVICAFSVISGNCCQEFSLCFPLGVLQFEVLCSTL